ncbi:Exopolysaccharide biosynthesis protein [uncultured Ruminococcus sp.]|nr:DUF1919 domain-containing protein [uncultured Ruminococcus sp.]SCI88459.1 Exopolysaccharide biosynthesis protein [uncultured Ruminococcus sp.]
MHKIINKIKTKILNIKINTHKKNVRKEYNGENITIISNNCIAGTIYNILGMQFCSPTINQWMKMNEYMLFIEDLKYYCECELIKNELESNNWKYPVGTLIAGDDNHKDINIYFNHYDDFTSARAKWEERKKRILWNKIYVIYDFNDKDIDSSLLYDFDKLPIKHKIALIHSDIPGLNNFYRMKCIGENDEIIKEFSYKGLSGKRYFEEWDYVSFLNEKD